MCKAGFAGDDAPRAVFRKIISWAVPFLGDIIDVHLASIVGRPRHHG